LTASYEPGPILLLSALVGDLISLDPTLKNTIDLPSFLSNESYVPGPGPPSLPNYGLPVLPKLYDYIRFISLKYNNENSKLTSIQELDNVLL
jgi:hypothetical protein